MERPHFWLQSVTRKLKETCRDKNLEPSLDRTKVTIRAVQSKLTAEDTQEDNRIQNLQNDASIIHCPKELLDEKEIHSQESQSIGKDSEVT